MTLKILPVSSMNRCSVISDLNICLLVKVKHPETNYEQLKLKSHDLYAMLAYVSGFQQLTL